MIFDLQLFTNETYLATSNSESVQVVKEGTKQVAKYQKEGASGWTTIKGKLRASTMVGVDAGAGNDSITVGAGVASLNIHGGTGADIIYIEPGTGNKMRYWHTDGHGKDSITGHWSYSRDILIVANAEEYTTAMSADGNEFYVKVGTGYVAFQNPVYGAKVKVSIKGTDGFTKHTIKKLMQGAGRSEEILNSLPSGAPLHQGTSSDDYWIIDAGAGSDSIANTGNYISIFGGEGYDSIVIAANNGTVTSGVSINGGNGNDTIDVTGDTIEGANFKTGEGCGGHVYIFDKADTGQDSIWGFNANDSIVLTNFEDSDNITSRVDTSGNFVIEFNDDSRLTIIKPADAELGGTPLNILKDGTLSTALSDKIADNVNGVYQIPKKILLNNASNNVSYNHDYDFYTIDAASGNDTVINNADFVSINGGAGNDSIVNTGDDVTIFGNYGNDAISLDGGNVTLQYAVDGSKNDHIYGYDSDKHLISVGAAVSLSHSAFDEGTRLILKGTDYASLNFYGVDSGYIRLKIADDEVILYNVGGD